MLLLSIFLFKFKNYRTKDSEVLCWFSQYFIIDTVTSVYFLELRVKMSMRRSNSHNEKLQRQRSTLEEEQKKFEANKLIEEEKREEGGVSGVY